MDHLPEKIILQTKLFYFFMIFLDQSCLYPTTRTRFLYFFCQFLIMKKTWNNFYLFLLVFESYTLNFMSVRWFVVEKWFFKLEQVLGGVHPECNCAVRGITNEDHPYDEAISSKLSSKCSSVFSEKIIKGKEVKWVFQSRDQLIFP